MTDEFIQEHLQEECDGMRRKYLDPTPLQRDWLDKHGLSDKHKHECPEPYEDHYHHKQDGE
ncbi:MAG: hypothetical protein WC333_06950 [Dehalococcoidia bacterium]|jgi:hypothetical protein